MRAEPRLRGALVAVAIVALAGALVELLLAEHTESPMQIVPFALALAGLATFLWFARSPSRRSIAGVRLVAAVLVAGSVVGVYEHLEGNIALELEVRPSVTAREVLWDAILGGAPLFAPGVLALAGAAAAAATIDHPADRAASGEELLAVDQ